MGECIKYHIERPLAKIRIPKKLAESKLSEERLGRYREVIKAKGYIGRALRLDRAGYLTEDYEAYLVLKEYKVEKAIVMVVQNGDKER